MRGTQYSFLSSQLHDGNLISVSTIDGTLTLLFSVAGRSKRVNLNGLERLRISDFKEGNIANSVSVYSGEYGLGDERYEELLRYVYDISNVASGNPEKTHGFLKEKLRELNTGNLLLLEIEPSYGCYLVALGRSISESESI